MTGRLRGAGPAGDAVDPGWGVGPTAAFGAVSGWLGRLGGALRGPDRAEPPAPPAGGGRTVADLVSARGLAGPPPAPAEDEPAESPDAPGDAPEARPVEPVVESPAVTPVVEEPAVDEPEAAGVDEPSAVAATTSDTVPAVADAGSPAALPQPSDPDLVAPPWVRASTAPADVEAPADLGEEFDPAAATDRLARPPRAVASAPAPRRPAPPLRTPAPPPPRSAARPPTRFSVAPRPTVVDDLAITGLTRRSNSRWGSRLFALFFGFVYLVILLQLIDSLLHPAYR